MSSVSGEKYENNFYGTAERAHGGTRAQSGAPCGKGGSETKHDQLVAVRQERAEHHFTVLADFFNVEIDYLVGRKEY